MTIENQKCIRCSEAKPLTEFYRHKQMKNGYLGACKICVKIGTKKREERLKQDPKWVEYEKSRHREKFHRLGKNWKKTVNKNRNLDYYLKFPEKAKAKNLSGHVKCPKGMHKHHWSYEEKNAKDVIILSPKDHYFFHRHHNYDQERMAYRNKEGVLMSKWDTIHFINSTEYKP